VNDGRQCLQGIHGPTPIESSSFCIIMMWGGFVLRRFNAAKGATETQRSALWMHAMLPKHDVDLIFWEHGMNDWGFWLEVCKANQPASQPAAVGDQSIIV
jgi:hypothetical protein